MLVGIKNTYLYLYIKSIMLVINNIGTEKKFVTETIYWNFLELSLSTKTQPKEASIVLIYKVQFRSFQHETPQPLL